MHKIAFVVIAALTAGVGPAAGAARNDLAVTLYADNALPYIDPKTGEDHPFMCLSPANPGDERPQCFGFYPRGAAITSIQLADGGALVRTGAGAGWTETPGGYSFVQVHGPADNVVLRDESRDLTWTLSIPRGGTQVTIDGKTSPWADVTAVTFAPGAQGFVGADWPGDDFQEQPRPWADAGLKFTKLVDARRRTDLMSIVRSWNQKSPPLTRKAMADFLDAVAATIGARRPPPATDQTPARYLEALIRLNP
jgi:hypothetical protein